MTGAQRTVLVSTTAALGLTCLAASVYLGLDRADKIASIISAIAGLGSLAIAVYQLTQSAGGRASGAPPRQVQRGGDNSTNIQSGGNITFGDSNDLGGGR
jgi:uncharacterized membrane protein YebE (DUF533 family)